MYKYHGVVPASTTEAAPLWEKLKIMKGTIVQWVVFQPEECADLLKFWVSYHGKQIFPWNTEEWAYGFFVPTPINESILIEDTPYELDFYAVNDDDSYEHEYLVYVNVEPPEPIAPAEEGEEGLWQRLREFFGGL